MTDKHRVEPNTSDVLASLLVDIERAWTDRGERPAIERLIALHPEFAEDLREFSSYLFDAEDADIEPAFLKAESAVNDWLRNGGIDAALSSAAAACRQSTTTIIVECKAPTAGSVKTESEKRPSENELSDSWITFLYHRTGRQRTEIASILPNMTLEFLSLVSRYPDVIPLLVKTTLAESVQRSLGVPAEESLECLSCGAQYMKRAASRRMPADQPPRTFEDILERAAFNDTARAFWRSCGEGQR